MPGHISMWTVYDHPKDYPSMFVARRLEIYGGGLTVMTGDVIQSSTLKDIRRDLRSRGLVVIERQDEDDPVIVETWL